MIERTRITLERCGKTFADGTRALDPIDLTIDGGETVVLLGPSGCGKTTTLRIIAGLETPDAGGRVLFGDDDVTPRPIEKRRVGMVFQSYALFPNMTVAENVGYGLKVQRVAAEERTRRVGRMLEMMHISDLAGRAISQLSGGQRQRVALARAIAVEPRVLLLDEPLTALDAKLRVSLRSEINRLLRTLGITAVYVTHDQDEAMALGDRIVAMNKGHIAQIGTPREIYSAPASRFVADFIGTSNRVPGRVTGKTLTCAPLRRPLSLPVTPRDGLADGPVEAFLRPDALTLASGQEGDIHGIVSEVLFMGDRQRLHVLAEGHGAPLVVDAPPHLDLREGAPIALGVLADRILVFPADPAPESVSP